MKIQINGGIPDPLGISYHNKGINFSVVCEKECGIIFYHNTTFEEIARVEIPKENKLGVVRYVCIEGIDISKIAYNYYTTEEEFLDPYAHRYYDDRNYGEVSKKRYGGFLQIKRGESNKPCLALSESIIYGIHVRGFTQHISSKVKTKERGTFAGIIPKIPYLKELGITTVELQPVYEFLEVKEDTRMTAFAKVNIEKDGVVVEPRLSLDYWGYKEGNYFSPKSLYTSTHNGTQEFYDLVKEFHKNNMEVILQFYFPSIMDSVKIIQILHFWAQIYDIDGFHLKGENIPTDIVLTDPALCEIKIFIEQQVPETSIEGIKNKFSAQYVSNFSQNMRKFLKGDDGTLLAALNELKYLPEGSGVIKYISDYSGFTLLDLVSYDRKHNELNGEENRDGEEQNYSCNCGEEGISRKKTVKSLRIKQLKNALTLLFIAKGTPLLFMGDEFGNSQDGNNNPYNQDNEITWLNWKNLKTYEEIFQYTKDIIQFRKNTPLLTMSLAFKMMDYQSLGIPDLSYHGEEAWNPCFSHYNKQVGILYNCAYGNEEEKNNYIYIAFNFHWESHSLGLPRLQGESEWEVIFSTDINMPTDPTMVKDTKVYFDKGVTYKAGDKDIQILPRSIAILKSKIHSQKKGK